MAIRTNYSENDFYNLIQNKINEFSENKPTYWGNGSIARAFTKSVAYIAENQQLQTNITFSSFRLKTAKGLHLDYRVGDFDTERTASTNAIGIQNFVGTTGRVVDITIPVGTTVTTIADIFGNTVNYTLNGTLILPSGSTAVTGLVTCTKEGTVGNVASGTITVLLSSIVGISGTYNVEDIGNGADDETDQELRTRIPNEVRGLQRANQFSIESAVYALPEITFVKVTENSPTEGNFTIYVTTDTGIVDSITRARVTNALRNVKAFCISFSIITPIISGITIGMDTEIDGENYQEEPMRQLIQQTVKNFVNTKAISALTLSDLNLTVRRIDGVLNCKNITINSVASDVALADTYVLKVNDVSDITVTFV